MIPVFRKIRRKMADDNKPMKYLRYAIGEIFLVVIGILIALQINNWNEANNQKEVLDDILQSIANGVQSDLRELNLLSAARANIVVKIDSIYNKYDSPDKTTLNIEEASYINFAFTNILNTVHLNTNISAFESLKNSTYFGKIQGTDLALLLNTYYRSADEIRSREDRYNQTIDNLYQEWLSHFRNNGVDLFMTPWSAGDFAIVGPRFLEIARDPYTGAIWNNGSREGTALKSYQEQILMGTKLVEMIRNSKTTFDQQTELEFSGILFTFGDADIVSLLINGEVPTGFDIRYAASDLFRNYISKEKDYLVMEYPANSYDWASAYFAVNALDGRVDEMDFSTYSKVVIEMRGETGAEAFEIGMKDINDPPDGSESKIKIELTDEWKVYEFETNQFITADMNRIMVPLAFVFEGPIGKKIHLKSVQFK
jgi:hypothetical protein